MRARVARCEGRTRSLAKVGRPPPLGKYPQQTIAQRACAREIAGILASTRERVVARERIVEQIETLRGGGVAGDRARREDVGIAGRVGFGAIEERARIAPEVTRGAGAVVRDR